MRIRIVRTFPRYSTVLMMSYLLLLTGCGSGTSVPTGTVSGNLKVAGKELTQGSVNFLSVDESTAVSGNLTADGSFEITSDVPVGEYKVYISPPSLGDVPPSEDSNPELRQPLKDVPEKYLSEATTDHIVTIAEGSNSLEINLTP